MATHRELESSKHQSRPIEYYHFFRGTEDWFYTSFKKRKTLDGNLYAPLEITRGQIETGGSDRPGALQVTFPTDSALGLVLQAGTAPTPINVRIFRQQPAASDPPPIIFTGEISTADVQGERVSVQCLPFTARLGQTAPQGLFQRRQCQWNTYDPNTCKANGINFRFTGTVSAISGLDVTVDGAEDFVPLVPDSVARDDMFNGGILRFGEYQAMIDTQDGDVMTLIESVPGLVVGSIVRLFAGDDRSPETCRDKFKNILRYMAFPGMPVTPPFTGQGLRP